MFRAHRDELIVSSPTRCHNCLFLPPLSHKSDWLGVFNENGGLQALLSTA